MKLRIALIASVIATLCLLATYKDVWAAIVQWATQAPSPRTGHNGMPDRGEYYWWNNPSGDLVWGTYILIWDSTGINGMRTDGWDPELEYEGFDPANPGLYCDQMQAQSFWATMPNEGVYPSNEACSPSVAEQWNVDLAENSSSWRSGTHYRGLGWWSRRIFWGGEVNFTYEAHFQDDWLGKMRYNSNFDWLCSTPPNPGQASCP